MPYHFTDSPTWVYLHFQTSDECHLVHKNDSFMSFYLISLTYYYYYQVASVVSDSLRPHRQQPTRLPRPWDSPGKNTGVGCHVLLQCMKVKSESEVAQSCPTPSNPMDCSLPVSPVHGTLQVRVLEWGAIAFSVH